MPVFPRSEIWHGGCFVCSSQQPELTAFITKFLLGGFANTTVMKTDGGFSLDKAKWLDWTVPSLQ